MNQSELANKCEVQNTLLEEHSVLTSPSLSHNFLKFSQNFLSKTKKNELWQQQLHGYLRANQNWVNEVFQNGNNLSLNSANFKHHWRIGYVDENGSAAKRSAGVVPEVNLRIPLNTGDEACKRGNLPWLWMKPRVDITRSPKTSVTPQKGLTYPECEDS